MTMVTVPRERALVGWHFMREADPDGMGRIAGLAHGGFRVRVGVEYVTPLTPKTCYHGFHASERAIDALRYSGPVVSLVRAWGEVDRDDDKWASSHRVALWAYDATEELRAFARSVALAAVDAYWPDAPAVVVDFLATGDVGLRAAAGAVARAVAGAVAGDAAGAVSRDAARDAARAAWAVAGDAWAAAWAAAGAAAGDAAVAASGAAAGAVARAAALDAARDAARAASRAAWAAAGGADVAAWAAAGDAAWAAMNEELESLLVSGAAARGLL